MAGRIDFATVPEAALQITETVEELGRREVTLC